MIGPGMWASQYAHSPRVITSLKSSWRSSLALSSSRVIVSLSVGTSSIMCSRLFEWFRSSSRALFVVRVLCSTSMREGACTAGNAVEWRAVTRGGPSALSMTSAWMHHGHRAVMNHEHRGLERT